MRRLQRLFVSLVLLWAPMAALSEPEGSCTADGVCTEGGEQEDFVFPSSGYFGPGDIVAPIRIPEQRVVDGQEFPLVLGPNPTVCRASKGGCTAEQVGSWVKHSKILIDNLLLKHGAILFRDFPLDTAEIVDGFIGKFGYDNFPYVGGAAVRRQLAPRVYTTNESPASEKIPFHHEMAQVPVFPTKVFFNCLVPAQEGGETPVLLSWEIARKLESLYPDFVKKLEEGVRYIRVMPEEDDPTSAIGRGWKSTYLTSDREEVEAKLRGMNSTWEWLADGSLKTISAVLPAIRKDEGPTRTNKKTFFNSVVAVYTGWNDSRNKGETAVQFADGSYLDGNVVNHTVQLMDELAVAFKWKKGDVIVVDNKTVMHSRRPFVGDRLISASLGTHPSR